MMYKLHLHRKKKEKRSEVTFKAKDVEKEKENEESKGDEHITKLTKQFKIFLKSNKQKRSSRPQSQQKKFSKYLRKNPTSSMKRTQNHIQCHEYEGF